MKDNVWFTFVFMLHFSTYTDAGPKCFSCTRIPFPRDCDHVTECGDHEVCHTKQIVSDGGHVFYDTGCWDSARCKSKRIISNDTLSTADDESGDLITCSHCCHGDYCNSQGCGTQPLRPYPEARGPLCFNCQKGTVSPKDCETVIVCSRDEHCAIEPIVGIGGDQLYRTGCKACGDISDVLVGKRGITPCSGCCKGEFCNNDCSSVSRTSAMTTLPASSLMSPTKQAASSTSKSTEQTTKRTPITLSSVAPSSNPQTVPVTLPTLFTKERQCKMLSYEYLKNYHHCVKPYKNLQLTWQQARDRCIQDGGDLLIFHNKPEESLFESWLLNMTGTSTRYWVGASDLGHEGKWLWVDSTVVDTKLYFHPGEPNDAGYPEGFHENCAAATYFADQNHRILLNDDNCTLPSSFICELNLSERCTNAGYTYEPDFDLCFKIFSTMATWQQARDRCLLEHAELAEPNTLGIVKFFDNYLKSFGTTEYWVGGKQSQSDPQKFIWQTTQQTIAQDLWHAGEPNNVNEQCVVLHWYKRQDLDKLFRLNDIPCNLHNAFICQYT
ncbi:uncharacterized protein LOC123553297 [Mercenaria mercenaria]|uniref:uncharacterized protein LOC123553297 n=1 Tax=Mercenaria mercenaria TaxID=6596 RepID=UPI00234F1279|nr:uncharacterized protein LOC123553297 [Mercenaria mercenaria]